MTRYGTTMSEALAEVREGFSPKQIKMAIGIASDKRYAGVNMSGAVSAIEKIKRGLADHPQVAAVLKAKNEETEPQESVEIAQEDVQESVPVYEGKMKELHGYISKGKTAEWIANKMGFNVKDIKSLMDEEDDLEEAAQILAHGGKGQYKAVTKNGSVSIMYKGKAIATGDFDRGADAFFLSWKDMRKGQKNDRPEGTGFDTAQDMVDFFAKKKITESLEEATATTKQKKALTSLMTKALGGKKSKPGYTSSIASNGDFVAYDGGMRIQGRIKKGDFTNPMTESYGSMNASVDKVKVQKQIDQTEKHMKTFFGNTSSVKMKKLAMQKKLDKLKAQLKEEVLLDEALELTEAMGNWTISVVKPVNKLKKGQNVSVKARSAFEAINKAMKHWKDPALKAVPATHFKIVKEEVELELDEGKDLTYTVVHARKGKVVVTAPTSYAAAQKAAKQWKLKSTGGVDAHLMKEEALQEASAYKVLHNTFSAAVQEAIAVAKKQGYDVDEDDWSNKVATGPKKPSKDKTNRYSIKLEKSGKPARKFLQIQVYNMGSKYELNCYVQ